MFSGIAAVATVFSFVIVPETRGRSLEELERELSELRLCGIAQTSGGRQKEAADESSWEQNLVAPRSDEKNSSREKECSSASHPDRRASDHK
jgi:hypothetical protein